MRAQPCLKTLKLLVCMSSKASKQEVPSSPCFLSIGVHGSKDPTRGALEYLPMLNVRWSMTIRFRGTICYLAIWSNIRSCCAHLRSFFRLILFTLQQGHAWLRATM